MKQSIVLSILLVVAGACGSPQNASQKSMQSSPADSLSLAQVLKAGAYYSDEGKLYQLLKASGKQNSYQIYQLCKGKDYHFTVLTRFLRAALYEATEYFNQKYQLEWQLSRYSLVEFGQLVYLYKTDKHKTFMDIGSGNGDKVYLASLMGFDKAIGIEYEPKLFEVSMMALKPMVEAGLIRLTQGDATKMEDSFYQQADFVYLYCPLVLNLPEQAKLTYRLLKNLPEGGFLYEAGFFYAQEINPLLGTNLPNGYRGFWMVKKENGKFYHKLFVKEWEELPAKF